MHMVKGHSIKPIPLHFEKINSTRNKKDEPQRSNSTRNKINLV